MSDEAPSVLPGVLREVAEATDLSTALTLAAELGGSRIFVPRDPRPGSKLVDAVGIDAARAIAALYPTENIDVPLGPLASHGRLQREILRLAEDGLSNQEIARRLHCHHRTVRRAKGRSQSASSQFDLFQPIDKAR